MKLLVALVVGVCLASTCAAGIDDAIARWQQELEIPGVAYAVIRNGEVVVATASGTNHDGSQFGLDTPLRFASVSKALAGTILAKASAQGRLDLDASASAYLPELAEDIRIWHLAAHVSEGEPGTEYVYGTQRYAQLESVIQRAYDDQVYADILKREVFAPASMEWTDSPHLGAHAGLVSTVNEMAKFVAAVQGDLLTEAEQKQLTHPFTLQNGNRSRVNLGWFVQELGGKTVLWSFGQDDPEHSSALLIWIPADALGFVLLANTDAASNPFRLLMGDLRYSPFASAFFANYAPEIAQSIPPSVVDAQGILAAAFMEKFDVATELFSQWAKQHANNVDADDLVMHFMTTAVAGALKSEQFIDYDQRAVQAHPANRWALLASAEYAEALQRVGPARRAFQAILDLPRQNDDFFRRLFLAWTYAGLARLELTADTAAARDYVQQGLDTGVSGPTRDGLLQIRAQIEASKR